MIGRYKGGPVLAYLLPIFRVLFLYDATWADNLWVDNLHLTLALILDRGKNPTNTHQQPTMADQPANIEELLCTPDFGSYDKMLANRLTNEATGQGFDR